MLLNHRLTGTHALCGEGFNEFVLQFLPWSTLCDSQSLCVQELPQEAKRFARIDKGWTKMMKRAFDTRNVLQVQTATVLLSLFVRCHVFGDFVIPRFYCFVFGPFRSTFNSLI